MKKSLISAVTQALAVLCVALLGGCVKELAETPPSRRPLVVYMALDNDLRGEFSSRLAALRAAGVRAWSCGSTPTRRKGHRWAAWIPRGGRRAAHGGALRRGELCLGRDAGARASHGMASLPVGWLRSAVLLARHGVASGGRIAGTAREPQHRFGSGFRDVARCLCFGNSVGHARSTT